MKIFRNFALLAAIALVGANAHALGDVNHNGGTAIANPVATGGTGIGVGLGGNAVQGQQQGQIATGGRGGQGGAGGQGGSASAGASSYSGGNSLVTNNRNDSAASNRTDVVVGGDSTVYEAQRRDPVATAYAAPLTASNGTCMGSTTGGLQLANVGFAGGTTWTDDGCDARYDAAALVQAGQRNAAIARLCQRDAIAKAMQSAGTPCPGMRVVSSTPRAGAAPGASAGMVQPEYTDPIIRRRMNLPPLN